MKILAVDCCLKLTGVALYDDGVIIDSSQNDLGRSQSKELPLITENIMWKNNISWNDLDYIAFTNGPGYFTGIRVGAAYSSGLAYACGVKIIPVSSLELLSCSFVDNNAKVLVLIYAGHEFVYAFCDKYLEAGEYSHEQIKSWLEKNPDAKIISDDPERTGLNHEFNIACVKPDLLTLCEIAREKITLALNPMEIKILYYRAPQGVK